MNTNDASSISRRTALTMAAGGTLAAMAGRVVADPVAPAAAPAAAAALKGNINHSLVSWCYFKHFDNDIDKFCVAAKSIGCKSIELIDPKHWATLKKHGLTCAISGSHGFVQGFNNPKHWDKCIATLTERIDQCAAAGVPSVISFTGMREPEIPDDVGAKNCIEGYKKILGHAEKNKVTICLEMLNSRYDINMVGHPGYQGDHMDYCIDILKKVGSERLKVLFDIYHVQIMDGDVITRIRQHKQYIGHIHTAGNPGRGELDNKQEINYPPIMEALVEVGYKGYVGHEYIPTREVMAGLKQAVALCDV
ncbi:hydroxypyruvate isomerase family protein [Humisphaera borealis]|nr:TIM barrel protein [Humisphaera borealis]